MADIEMQDVPSEGDGNIICLMLESPPPLSFHEMRLADIRRFQIKPVPGIPLNQQAPGVYLHPTEPHMILTVSVESEHASSPYMDALAAEQAAIEAEMAEFDEPVRKEMDAAIRVYNDRLLRQDAFPSSDTTNTVLSIPTDRQSTSPDATVSNLIQRQGRLALEQWKNELRSLVVERYHLDAHANQEAQSAVITNLLKDCAFLNEDGEEFRASIVKAAFEILDKRLHLESKPNKVYKLPKMTPCQSIAFVATALECCLDEWKSGQRVDLAFKAESYKGRYEEHHKNVRFLATRGAWRF
ncbi:hypothetical protein C8J56DRAFT_912807 [Mycena floridula]|nr:hypothetical protein C8J56DRAFT_912807 [Mycena floridula]